MISHRRKLNIFERPTLTYAEDASSAPWTSLDVDFDAGLHPEEDGAFFEYLIGRRSQALQRAEALYQSARFAGQVSRYISWLFHQPTHLMEASEVIPGEITASSFSGLRSVSINHVIASVGRICDFDFAFNPLTDKNRTCWVNMAASILLGVELPAVDLLQFDHAYIICNGHNRISVARALGRDNVNAYVTKLSCPLNKYFESGSKLK